MRTITRFIVFLLLSACVDRINFPTPPAQLQTVLEGYITNSPGPYTVKVSRSLGLNEEDVAATPVEHAAITLFDDMGNTEEFTETKPGTYVTGGVLQGQIGHSYHVRMETANGKVFESEPDMIHPVGKVENVRTEFESKAKARQTQADVFNVYVGGHAGNEVENYVRWRFTGTYEVFTYPHLHTLVVWGFLMLDPFPCSGYEVQQSTGGGKLVKVAECTCCTCWVNQFEAMPVVSDGQYVNQKQFSNIKVAEVPVNNSTFHKKYMVNVEQMSLSKSSYEFFKLIRTQREGASSLFQPPTGVIRGNVKAVNSDEPVVGIFWATSIDSKIITIDPADIPYKVPEIQYFAPCNTFYPNSSTDQPVFWE